MWTDLVKEKYREKMKQVVDRIIERYHVAFTLLCPSCKQNWVGYLFCFSLLAGVSAQLIRLPTGFLKSRVNPFKKILIHMTQPPKTKRNNG
jgi:hypothetical protein